MGLEKLYPHLGVKYKKGETVFSEGEKSDAFYLILEGKVKIVRYRKDKEIILAILLQNQFFGEMGAFRNALRTASAIAETDVKLLRFPSDDLLALVKRYPNVGIKILKVLAFRLSKINKRLEMATLQNFRVKLLRSLAPFDIKTLNEKKLTPKDLISLFDLNVKKDELVDFILKSRIGTLSFDGTVKFNRFV
jgi:CRP-like cAMP-binding protein